MPTIPSWTESLLQGLAFWVGYKRVLFPHYHISEAAVVSEARDLLYANRKADMRIESEYNSYAKDRLRCDLFIRTSNESAIIEVKVGHQSRKLTHTVLRQDIERLATHKVQYPSHRCFLLCVSQSVVPSVFVERSSGTAIRAKRHIRGHQVLVRRVCKAASSFASVSSANYAVLVEVI